MKIRENTLVAIYWVYAVFFLLFFGGWIANIVKLVSSSFDLSNWLTVLRFIGIFVAPAGAVLGYM